MRHFELCADCRRKAMGIARPTMADIKRAADEAPLTEWVDALKAYVPAVKYCRKRAPIEPVNPSNVSPVAT